MKINYTFVAFLFFFAPLQGCATFNHSDHDSSVANEQPLKYLPVELVTLKAVVIQNKNDAIEPDAIGRDVDFSLRAIPGALVGRPLLDRTMDFKVRVGDEISLPINRLGNAFGPLASTASPEMKKSGLTVTPEETRFLRVGTFSRYTEPSISPNLVGAKFIDAKTRQSVLLLYFDRPCKIAGATNEGNSIVSASLTIPSAGFYWIRNDNTSTTHRNLTLNDPSADIWFGFIQ
jgi:hypothetical protein